MLPCEAWHEHCMHEPSRQLQLVIDKRANAAVSKLAQVNMICNALKRVQARRRLLVKYILGVKSSVKILSTLLRERLKFL